MAQSTILGHPYRVYVKCRLYVNPGRSQRGRAHDGETTLKLLNYLKILRSEAFYIIPV